MHVEQEGGFVIKHGKSSEKQGLALCGEYRGIKSARIEFLGQPGYIPVDVSSVQGVIRDGYKIPEFIYGRPNLCL